MNEKTFAELNLKPWIIRQCLTIGIKTPTPVQCNCIPPILEGKDCVGAAKTGSGKTLAFALPILQTLSDDPYGIYTLILTPTRELAYQISCQFMVMGKPINLRTCVIVGGVDIVEQGKELSKRPHIVIATPGRLADHLESCMTFSLTKIKYLVMDEADRLLNGSFDGQLKTIFTALPKKKQTLFFSATITDTLDKLKEVTGNEMFMYEAPSNTATVDELNQQYLLCPNDVRDAYLVEALRKYKTTSGNGNIIVFTDTCKNCQIISMMLNDVGFENVALHGMISQNERLAALTKFKSNTVKILVATDVASRGLDIPAVELVLNHRVPKVPKEYIHRVGRTARAGRTGRAITMLTPNEITALQKIEKLIKTKLTEFKVDDKEVCKIYTQISVSKSEAHLSLDEKDFYEKRLINKRKRWIMDGLDPDEEERKLLKKFKRKLNNGKHKKKGVNFHNKQKDRIPTSEETTSAVI